MKKQFLAKLAVLALVLAMLPTAAFAARVTVPADKVVNGYYDGHKVSWDGTTYYYDTEDTSSDVGGNTSTPAPDTTTRVDEPVAEDGAIEANVVNGTAKVALSDKAVESLADLAEDGEIVLEIKDEGATKLDVSFSAKAMTKVAEETGADLTIKSTVVTVTIPNEALSTELGNGTLRVTAQVYTNSVGFTISASGKALKSIKGITVTF